MCGLGATVYTVVLLFTGNLCFLWNNLHEPVKVFHEGGPVLHEDGPTWRVVSKQ